MPKEIAAREGGWGTTGRKSPRQTALQWGNGRRLTRSFSRMRDARYLGCKYLPVSGLSFWEIGLAGRTAGDLQVITAMSQSHVAAFGAQDSRNKTLRKFLATIGRSSWSGSCGSVADTRRGRAGRVGRASWMV